MKVGAQNRARHRVRERSVTEAWRRPSCLLSRDSSRLSHASPCVRRLRGFPRQTPFEDSSTEPRASASGFSEVLWGKRAFAQTRQQAHPNRAVYVSKRFLGFLVASFACLAQPPPGSPAVTTRPSAANYTIAGTVVNAVSGEALPDVKLSLAPNTDRTDQITVSSDAAGHFAFGNLPAGKYALTAKRRGFLQQALDQHDAFSTAVVVGPKLDAEHIVFRLPPAGMISGNVLDEDNEPVGAAQVWLFIKSVSMGVASSHFIGSSQTNEKGRYRFSSLGPGTYFLAVTAQPWYAEGQQRFMMRPVPAGQPETEPEAERSPFDVAFPLTYYNGASDFAAATPMTLTAGSSATANVTLRAVPAVHLRVQQPPDEPGRQRNIQLFHEGPGGMRMYVNVMQYGDGSGNMYIGGFAPGHYEVESHHFDSKDGKPLDGGVQTIDVVGDGTFEPHLAGAPSISGKVVSERPLSTGQPLFVQLLAAPSLNLGSSPVAVDGSVSFPGVVAKPGKYAVFVVGQPDISVESVSATGAKASGRMVEVTGSNPVELTIKIASGQQAEVKGYAIEDDKPVAGAIVLLLPEDSQSISTFVPRDQSDTDGSFELRQVTPGKYRAIAIDDGAELEYTNPEAMQPYLGAAQSVSVTPGGQVKLQLVVQRRVK